MPVACRMYILLFHCNGLHCKYMFIFKIGSNRIIACIIIIEVSLFTCIMHFYFHSLLFSFGSNNAAVYGFSVFRKRFVVVLWTKKLVNSVFHWMTFTHTLHLNWNRTNEKYFNKKKKNIRNVALVVHLESFNAIQLFHALLFAVLLHWKSLHWNL